MILIFGNIKSLCCEMVMFLQTLSDFIASFNVMFYAKFNHSIFSKNVIFLQFLEMKYHLFILLIPTTEVKESNYASTKTNFTGEIKQNNII